MSNQPELKTSILDRLIDHQPGLTAEPVPRRVATLGVVREAVLRDLENLLNARRSIRPVPESSRQARSILSYGARDFSSLNLRSQSVRQQIGMEIERLLVIFEPRLKSMTVRLDTASGSERTLHYRINALLLAEPVTAPITFDTCLDINSGGYSIHE